MTASDRVSRVTRELSREIGLHMDQPELDFRPIPHPDSTGRPTWRIQIDLVHDSDLKIGLDINDEVVLGRERDSAEVLNLVSYEDGEALGISRRHALLRPTASKLYIIDLDSTNGIKLNDHRIGVNTPYRLTHGDHLTLGRLEMTIQILKTPTSSAPAAPTRKPIDTMMIEIGTAIMAQLTVEDVLQQAIELVRTYTHANEASVWLVDEHTGELFLEAEQGIEDERVHRMRLSVADSLAGKVVSTGQPIMASSASGEQVKVKTGYLVEAALYVPLKLGGVAFGVLFAACREPGVIFGEYEEKITMAIAEFTAVAVQNARLYQAGHATMRSQTKILTALNYTLLRDLKQQLNMIIGSASMLATVGGPEHDPIETAQEIISASNRLTVALEKISEVMAMGEDLHMRTASCDLIDIVEDALNDLYEPAEHNYTKLDLQIIGDPYTVEGNAGYLRRAVFNLVDNAIRYSPPAGRVKVTLAFGQADAIIRVQDSGPGIPEEDIPYLLERYYRGTDSVGLGLGLELARSIVEAHRGTLTVRNNEGGGAEFIITLPPALRNA